MFQFRHKIHAHHGRSIRKVKITKASFYAKCACFFFNNGAFPLAGTVAVAACVIERTIVVVAIAHCRQKKQKRF